MNFSLLEGELELKENVLNWCVKVSYGQWPQQVYEANCSTVLNRPEQEHQLEELEEFYPWNVKLSSVWHRLGTPREKANERFILKYGFGAIYSCDYGVSGL